MLSVQILDHVAGHIRSLVNGIEKLGYEVEWIKSPEDIQKGPCRSSYCCNETDAVILPACLRIGQKLMVRERRPLRPLSHSDISSWVSGANQGHYILW